MKIELEAPYSNDWKYGYIVVNKEPRRNVILYNSNKDRSTVSFARYMMSVNLGYYIGSEFVVDHINGDQMDDRLENYQLLTSEQNKIKGDKQNNSTRQMVDLVCGYCGEEFTKPRNTTHLVIKKNSDYCSRVCSGKSKVPSTVIREYRA